MVLIMFEGGSYVKVELDDFQKETLYTEIWSAKDLCTQCGRSGHFVKDCYAETNILGNKIEYEYEWCCEYCDRTFTSEIGCTLHEKSCKKNNKNVQIYNAKKTSVCYRCGRPGHYSPDCYARTHSSGYILDSNSGSDYESD